MYIFCILYALREKMCSMTVLLLLCTMKIYFKCWCRNVLRGSGYPTLLCNILIFTNSCMYHNFADLLHSTGVLSP